MAAVVRINLLMQDDAPIKACCDDNSWTLEGADEQTPPTWWVRVQEKKYANLYFCLASIISQCHNNEIKLELITQGCPVINSVERIYDDNGSVRSSYLGHVADHDGHDDAINGYSFTEDDAAAGHKQSY